MANRAWTSLRVWASIAIMLVLLVFGFTQLKVSPADLGNAFLKFSWVSILAAFSLLLLQSLSMALRMFFLVPRAHKVDFRDLGYAMGLGQLANGFLPARAGDPLRIFWLSQPGAWGTSLDAVTGAGVLASDKLVDFVAILGLALWLKVYAVPGVHLLPQVSAGVFAGIALLVAVLGFGVWRYSRRHPSGKMADALAKFSNGIRGALVPRALLLALFWGFMVWFSEALAFYLLCSSQGLGFSLSQAFFALVVLNILVAVPLTFGNFGPYEASLAFALSLMGVETATGIAIATAHHLLQLSNNLAFAGAFALYRRLASSQRRSH